jgi:hypothetical protein
LDCFPSHPILTALHFPLELHHLAGDRYSTVVGEKSLRWAVLEDGDEIVIGPHRLRFDSMVSP